MLLNLSLRKLSTLALLALVFLALPWSASAAELTDADAIITRANLASYYAGDDGRAQARMRIVDAQGRKQLRQFTILRKNADNGGDQDMLVFFEKPADVAGTVFRVAKHAEAGKEDDRWLYLPGLDLVKRISAGDNRTSFVGAHFYYEDVSGRDPRLDNFTLLATTEQFYRIKGVPKDSSLVEFSDYVVEVDKQSFLPMQMRYHNAQGEVIRTLKVLKVKTVDGHPTVLHSKITDNRSGGYTEMQFRKVQYDVGLPASIYSERSLRNPPKKWLR